VTEVDVLIKDNISISSTKVRNLVSEGRITEANALLGYEFILTGKVIKGLGRGKNLGFPTANIVVDSDKIKPANGVYFIKSKIDGKHYNGVANIGTRPTVNGVRNQLEVHIFDLSSDLYGKPITVFPMAKIRDEIKFDTPELLSLQLDADKKKCFHLIRTIKKTI
jgi:riboflavin kinase/FMN adenylyltransferase